MEMKVNYTDELTIQLTSGQRKLLLNRLKFNLPSHNNTELDDHINWFVQNMFVLYYALYQHC